MDDDDDEEEGADAPGPSGSKPPLKFSAAEMAEAPSAGAKKLAQKRERRLS